jgi:hypothetical protein
MTRLTLPAVAALALACLLLGTLAAFANGATPTHVRYAVAVPVAPAEPPPLPDAGPCGPAPATKATDKAPAAQPVPQNLLDAFGVLRRAPTGDDALPATALNALRIRGLEPFDPAAARLLRTTADGGHAWVVPVRDARTLATSYARCAVPVSSPTSAARERARARARQRARGHAAAVARPATPAVPLAPTPAVPSPAPKPAAGPQPGLAVVALGGAPSGAGGRLSDLVRGRETVSVAACAGPNKDMLSVSGIVPDGVPAAFLTTADGAAVRADVKDNAYAFVVPAAKAREQRYVVWTGGDGTPHVQPLPAFFSAPPTRCAATSRFPVVSPNAIAPGLVVPVRPRVPQRRG